MSSPRPKTDFTSVPGATSSKISMMPSSPMWGYRPAGTSSSGPEHSMPMDTSPRILPFLILPPGRCAPSSAAATRMPSRTLGAPQTIWMGSASPTSTMQMCRWSELGWSTQDTTLPTTTLSNCAPVLSTPSTAVPVMTILLAYASADTSMSTYSFSHFMGTFIAIKPPYRHRTELFQWIMENGEWKMKYRPLSVVVHFPSSILN